MSSILNLSPERIEQLKLYLRSPLPENRVGGKEPSLSEVVSVFTALHEGTPHLVGNCPFIKSTKPNTFIVTTAGDLYRCNDCMISGIDPVQFLMDVMRIPYGKASDLIKYWPA